MVPAAPTLGMIAANLRDACGERAGVLCRSVYNVTHSQYLASGAEVFLATPFRILVILLLAFLVRTLLRRVIDRTVRKAAEGDVGAALRRRGRTQGRLLGAIDDSALLTERRRQRVGTVGSLLKSITSVVVFGVAFVTILGELDINLAPIVASAGVIGIAVGFGAQNLVRDFLTGMFMLLEDQYGVGDVIDAGPASGVVEAVGLRTTRLRDVEGVVWYVRNGEISRVGNKSQNWSRAVLDVPVAFSADVDRVRTVLKNAADDLWKDPDWEGVVLEEPEVWGIESMNAESVTIRLVAKTAPLKQWDVARALRERIKNAFHAAGIELPVQQQEVTVRDEDDRVPTGSRADEGGEGGEERSSGGGEQPERP